MKKGTNIIVNRMQGKVKKNKENKNLTNLMTECFR